MHKGQADEIMKDFVTALAVVGIFAIFFLWATGQFQ